MSRSQPQSTFRRRRLGRLLRKLREDASLNQQQVCTELRINDSKLSRFELGHQVPDYQNLRALLDLYFIPVNEWDPIVEIWEKARVKGWYHAYGLDDLGYVSMEDEAAMIREFQFGFVPGLLQTPDYINTVFTTASIPHSPSYVTTQIEVRRRRQLRLTAEDPLEVHAIIDESVLRRQTPSDVMSDQINHLLIVSELDSVMIQILPSAVGLHSGLNSNFIVLSFPDPEEPDAGYMEHVAGAVQIEKPEEVATCKLVFDDLARRALSPEESVRFLERLVSPT